jgi:hypothetical protein
MVIAVTEITKMIVFLIFFSPEKVRQGPKDSPPVDVV